MELRLSCLYILISWYKTLLTCFMVDAEAMPAIHIEMSLRIFFYLRNILCSFPPNKPDSRLLCDCAQGSWCDPANNGLASSINHRLTANANVGTPRRKTTMEQSKTSREPSTVQNEQRDALWQVWTQEGAMHFTMIEKVARYLPLLTLKSHYPPAVMMQTNLSSGSPKCHLDNSSFWILL